MQDTELIYIETEKIKLTIKGQPYHRDAEKLCLVEEKNAQAKLSLNPLQSKVIAFSHYSPKEEGLVAYQGDEVFPCFYEWQDYEIIIQSKNEQELEFYHQNKNLREAVSPLSYDKNILTGKLKFRNNVGYSEFEIRQASQPLLTFTIEVFPSRINYKQDYQQLLTEVNQEVYNLAYDFLRRTFQQMELAEAENISHSEFFAILTSIFADFKQAFRRIKENPHRNLSKNPKVKPAARVKKVSRQGVKWLQKNPHAYDKQEKLPKKMLSSNKKVNFNTFENKFVKWMIKEIIKGLDEFLEHYQKLHQNRQDQQLLAKIQRMKQELKLCIKRSFLKEVGELYKLDNLSLVLQMAPGYREVYKYYLMLKKGLSVNGELFNLSLKETWELYEYWCFLKLNQILRNKYKLVKNNLIAFDHSGLYVTLSKARSANVEYENSKTGEKFKLAYNTRVGEKVTTGQQPDNILTLKKENSQVDYKFIFDAKYSINPAHPGSTYYNKYHTPGPKEETINAMHRYRDAIVSQENFEFKRKMVGAYVLFPYHKEEEFKEHHFYQSIEAVNVGAFPFLPGSIDLVANFLAELVEETALSSYERNLASVGNKEYQQQIDFNRNVLVGSLSQPKQLKEALEKEIYHIPCQRLKLSNQQLKYLALYQSKRKFPQQYGVKHYAIIENIEVKPRKEIPIPLSASSKPEEYYYLFKLKQWEQLDEAILPEGYGVSGSHIYTNDMLLKKAKTLPELSIKTLDEWRIWLELKRIKSKLEVLTKDKQIKNTTKIKGFKLAAYQILIIGERLVVKKYGQELFHSEIKEFLKQPRNILNKVIKLLEDD